MINSMTGFSRARGASDRFEWSWEIRSVNGRNLDIRMRLPAGFERIDREGRQIITRHLGRGNVSAALNFTDAGGQAAYRINDALLDQLCRICVDFEGRPGVVQARLDGLLAIRGVVEPDESILGDEERKALEDAMLLTLEEAVRDLNDVRGREGAALLAVISGLLDDLERECAEAAAAASGQPAAIRDRLNRLLAEIGADNTVSEDRLAQEVALLAVKADIREELDRLQAHVVAARDLLEQGGAIGRKFDFLCQEFNREANTICSKAQVLELTRAGLAIKGIIDRIREQVQNIE